MYRRIVTTSLVLCGMLCILAVPQQTDGDWQHSRFFFSAAVPGAAPQAESERSEQRPSTTVTATATTQTKKHHQRIIAAAATPPRQTAAKRVVPLQVNLPLAPPLSRFSPRGPPTVC